MNINELKVAIGTKTGVPILKLDLHKQKDENGDETDWRTNWNDDTRTRIVMHKSIEEAILKDPIGFNGLAFKYEEVPATELVAAYTQIVVITPSAFSSSL